MEEPVRIDLQYLATSHGLVKIGQIIVTLAAAICFACVDDQPATAGFALFVVITSLLTSIIITIIYIFHIEQNIHNLAWFIVQLVYTAFWAVCNGIAGCVAAFAVERRQKAGQHQDAGLLCAAAAFCFLSFILYFTDWVLFWQKHKQSTAAATRHHEPAIRVGLGQTPQWQNASLLAN